MGWVIFIIWVVAELAARFWPLRIILLALPVLWLASLELEHRKRLRRARKARTSATREGQYR
jgi:hypothetical protein